MGRYEWVDTSVWMGGWAFVWVSGWVSERASDYVTCMFVLPHISGHLAHVQLAHGRGSMGGCSKVPSRHLQEPPQVAREVVMNRRGDRCRCGSTLHAAVLCLQYSAMYYFAICCGLVGIARRFVTSLEAVSLCFYFVFLFVFFKFLYIHIFFCVHFHL
jgi:hypothetical protein